MNELLGFALLNPTYLLSDTFRGLISLCCTCSLNAAALKTNLCYDLVAINQNLEDI